MTNYNFNNNYCFIKNVFAKLQLRLISLMSLNELEEYSRMGLFHNYFIFTLNTDFVSCLVSTSKISLYVLYKFFKII